MAEIETNQTLLQEESLKSLDIQEGSLVEGTIISVSGDSVSVGIGYKSDGILPVTEFKEPPQIGQKIKVVLVRKEGQNGTVEISKEKAEAITFRDDLTRAFESKLPLQGKFSKIVKGGYEVDLGHEYMGFVPLSKADSVRVEKPEELLGKVADFLVEKLIWEKKANIVLNRRDLMLRLVDQKKEAFFATAKEGDVVQGTVKSFTSFGAFVDLGGFDALLHLNDMSWGHVSRPKDFINLNDLVKLKILRLDPVEKKINLSLKLMTESPWKSFEKTFHVGDLIQGKVTKLADYGAFIEIIEGVEGLVHISEMSWVKRISHPKEILKVGDNVQIKLLAYDMENNRVSLGLKQVSGNPWDHIADNYPVGKVINLQVKKVTPAGAFLTLEEGIDGFLHVDDLSWTKKVRNATSELKDGQTIDVKVLGVDSEAHRIRLGVKQISEDPWKNLHKTYPKGAVVTGEVVGKTDFGVFVRVPGGIDGLVNKANVCDPRDKEPDEVMKSINIGDKLQLAVVEVNVEKQKLALSLRDFDRLQQKEELSKYLQKGNDHSSFTIGDFLKK